MDFSYNCEMVVTTYLVMMWRRDFRNQSKRNFVFDPYITQDTPYMPLMEVIHYMCGSDLMKTGKNSNSSTMKN